MKARKSYTELMKETAMSIQKKIERTEQNFFIEMLLSEITLKAEKNRLKRNIDHALDVRDYQSFIELTKRLQDINQKLNT